MVRMQGFNPLSVLLCVLEKWGMQMGKNKWIAGWVWANMRTSQMLTIDTIYYLNVCTVTKIIYRVLVGC